MERFSKEKIEYLKTYDFFSRACEERKEEDIIKTKLIYGHHQPEAPLITVLITTYRRNSTLKQAITSAIEQVGFEDYEIIVSDNSGEDEALNHETEELIKSFHCDKLIYYRHEKTMMRKSTRAARLVRTKWFCFLHDDDMLAANHLQVMSRIVKENPRIHFLACKPRVFHDDGYKPINEARLRRVFHGSYQAEYYDERDYNYGFTGNWLGALIEKKTFFRNGGMADRVETGIGDYVMTTRFAYYSGTYICDAPLYCYRIWKGQVSSSSAGNWEDAYIAEYFFYRYISSKRNLLLRPFFYKLSKYMILQRIEMLRTGLFKFYINMNSFKQKCGIEKEDIRDWQFHVFLSIYHGMDKIRRWYQSGKTIYGKI